MKTFTRIFEENTKKNFTENPLKLYKMENTLNFSKNFTIFVPSFFTKKESHFGKILQKTSPIFYFLKN